MFHLTFSNIASLPQFTSNFHFLLSLSTFTFENKAPIFVPTFFFTFNFIFYLLSLLNIDFQLQPHILFHFHFIATLTFEYRTSNYSLTFLFTFSFQLLSLLNEGLPIKTYIYFHFALPLSTLIFEQGTSITFTFHNSYLLLNLYTFHVFISISIRVSFPLDVTSVFSDKLVDFQSAQLLCPPSSPPFPSALCGALIFQLMTHLYHHLKKRIGISFHLKKIYKL